MPSTSVLTVEEVGPNTVSIEVESPQEFEAAPGQFVLVRVPVDDDTESGYYTIASENADESFDICVEYGSEGTVGPWLAQREPGDEISFDGPYGDIRYTGGEAVVVVSGPGIGPGVGIAERAALEGDEVTVVYLTDAPAYESRLTDLTDQGIHVDYVQDADAMATSLQSIDRSLPVFVFGYAGFVESVQNVVDDTDIEAANLHVESFGPE